MAKTRYQRYQEGGKVKKKSPKRKPMSEFTKEERLGLVRNKELEKMRKADVRKSRDFWKKNFRSGPKEYKRSGSYGWHTESPVGEEDVGRHIAKWSNPDSEGAQTFLGHDIPKKYYDKKKYHTWRKYSKHAYSFRDFFREARKAGKKTFKWHGNEYTTELAPKEYQKGGKVDTVPAMLEPGEYVIKRSSAEKIGYKNLNKMNRSGKMPKAKYQGYQEGGKVKKKAPEKKAMTGWMTRMSMKEVSKLEHPKYTKLKKVKYLGDQKGREFRKTLAGKAPDLDDDLWTKYISGGSDVLKGLLSEQTKRDSAKVKKGYKKGGKVKKKEVKKAILKKKSKYGKPSPDSRNSTGFRYTSKGVRIDSNAPNYDALLKDEDPNYIPPGLKGGGKVKKRKKARYGYY